MPSTMTTQIQYADLSDAFEFASATVPFGPFEQAAFIALDSGTVVYRSEAHDDVLPPDLDDRSRYLPVPTRQDLSLGSRLAFLFTERCLPQDRETVHDYFTEHGAYARFKELLLQRGQLEAWYDFEARETELALRAWAGEQGLEVT